jgi:hypothetical protein
LPRLVVTLVQLAVHGLTGSSVWYWFAESMRGS